MTTHSNLQEKNNTRTHTQNLLFFTSSIIFVGCWFIGNGIISNRRQQMLHDMHNTNLKLEQL